MRMMNIRQHGSEGRRSERTTAGSEGRRSERTTAGSEGRRSERTTSYSLATEASGRAHNIMCFHSVTSEGFTAWSRQHPAIYITDCPELTHGPLRQSKDNFRNAVIVGLLQNRQPTLLFKCGTMDWVNESNNCPNNRP